MDVQRTSRVKDRLDTSAESKTANVVVWEPEQGDHLWVFPESEDKLGSGGEFHIYVDPITQPEALASFARFSLGVGGDLAEHKHNRSQELAYLISGEGTVKGRQDGVLVETPINAGSVWYIPPGAWHAVKNTGTSPLVMVFATVPNVEKGLLSFFRRIATIPGQKPTVLSREELARIGAEHDFVLKAASTNA